MDYEEYVKGDISVKKKLIIDNVLRSVKSISKRGKIHYRSFEEDVKTFCIENDIKLS